MHLLVPRQCWPFLCAKIEPHSESSVHGAVLSAIGSPLPASCSLLHCWSWCCRRRRSWCELGPCLGFGASVVRLRAAGSRWSGLSARGEVYRHIGSASAAAADLLIA